MVLLENAEDNCVILILAFSCKHSDSHGTSYDYSMDCNYDPSDYEHFLNETASPDETGSGDNSMNYNYDDYNYDPCHQRSEKLTQTLQF